MKFIERHTPQNITELVFYDADVNAIINDYANGLLENHLLLHGPAGSGKSIAAKMILKNQLGSLANSALGTPIHPRSYPYKTFDTIMYSWSAQKTNGATHTYTIIDEIDRFSASMLEKLCDFIANIEHGTIICTTNKPHKLDDPFKDRFCKLHVKRPTAADWTNRAQTILAAEGVLLTKAQVETLLHGFEGSARELIEWLEHYVLNFKRNPISPVPPAQPSTVLASSSSSTAPTSNKAFINGKPLSTKK